MTERRTPAASKGARKQQKRSIVTQQKLLAAAISAFAENGFAGTSTRDIADRAGVHHPLITYHFRNKDRLWRASADHLFRDFNVALVKALGAAPETGPKARAETVIRSYVRYAGRQPALHRFILQESSYPGPRLDWLIETHLKPLFTIVSEHIAELQRLRVAPAGNPALLYNMIRVSTGGLLALAHEVRGTTGIDLESDSGLDELADMIIRVFLPGIPPADA